MATQPPRSKPILVAPMNSFEDVRQVLGQHLNDLQNRFVQSLPLTSMQGQRLQNVGDPQAPNDAVNLAFIIRYIVPQLVEKITNSSGSITPPAGTRSISIGPLTEDTIINAINTSGMGVFLWTLTVIQDAVGGRSMIPGTGLTFALSTSQSPANTQVVGLIYYDGSGNHILIASTGDQPIP